MIKLRNLQLRHQLFLLITVTVTTLMLVHFYDVFSFYKLTQQRSEVFTSNLLKQFEENLTSISKDIQKTSELIGYSAYIQEYIGSSAMRKYELNSSVNETITYAKSSNKNVFDVVIIDNDGRENGGQYIDRNTVVAPLKSKYIQQDPVQNKATFSGLIRNEYGSYFAYISPFAYYMGPQQYQKAGTALIICKTDNLQSIIDKMQLSPKSLLLVLDNDDTVAAANNKQLIGTTFNSSISEELSPENNKVVKKYNGYQSIIQHIDIRTMGWKIVSITPITDLTYDMRPMIFNVSVIGSIISAILFLTGLIFIRSITIPLSRIISFLRSVREQRLHNRLDVIEKNEMGLLSASINQMLDEIDDMNKKIFSTQSTLYEAELAKKQAQLSALQAQINPHFLYNTLDCIRNIALDYDCNEISTISTCMAKIFRYSVKGDDVVLIRDELDCIKNYLEIISIRYSGKFQIQLNVEETLLNIKTIKFIIQPIIENAVYHGLESRIDGGLLKIDGQMNSKGNIYFEVSDNGVGMKAEDLEKLTSYLTSDSTPVMQAPSKGVGIGLVNINSRIRYYYGNQYGITVESQEKKGTKVTIEFPPME